MVSHVNSNSTHDYGIKQNGARETIKYCFLVTDNRQTTTHGLGNVLSQIVLGKSMKPDFDVEERLSIEKDTREIRQIIREMAEYLPLEDPDKGTGKTSNVHSR